MRDYQESVTTRQTDGQTNGQTDGQRDARQSDPYKPLFFAGDTKMILIKELMELSLWGKYMNLRVLHFMYN